jgi:type I restriction enzyme, R subunit
VTVDPQLEELAQRTPNFGFLLAREAVLVGYGTAAESMVFTDPNTSMIKARQFGEQLVTALVTTFGIRIPADKDTQHKRLKVLLDQGVINKRVHSWFDAVRDTGNKAVHEGFAAQRDALRLVRACYDLGAWFHRTVSQSREAPPFVPPQPPRPAAPPRDLADAVALTELNDQLGSYHAELVEMRLRLDEQASLAAAEAQARREAEAEILAAVGGQGDLHRLVSELTTRFDELSRDLTQRAEAPPRLDAARRDALVAQAQIASRPPLSEAQVRRVIDRMLAQAGWVVQEVATTNLRVATGVAVREVSMARGRADYLLYIDGALVGVIEAKREGVGLIGPSSSPTGMRPGSRRDSSSMRGVRRCRSGTSRPESRRGSPTVWTPSRAAGGCSPSTNRRRSPAGCARRKRIRRRRRCGPGCAECRS